MSRYDFDFQNATHRGKQSVADLTIYPTGAVYLTKNVIERFHLEKEGLRWGEDKAQHTLAIRRDEKGRTLSNHKGCKWGIPVELAREYAGKYNLVEEEGVLVLHPLNKD